MSTKTKKWLRAALVRSLRTAAQTMVAMIPVGVTVSEVSWSTVFGTAILAGILCILTSVAGLPEVKDGDDDE